MNKKFDMKISKKFSGRIEYIVEDYINEVEYTLDMAFDDGKIQSITLVKEDGEIVFLPDSRVKRYNSKFWRNAPKFANFNDKSFRRGLVMNRFIHWNEILENNQIGNYVSQKSCVI